MNDNERNDSALISRLQERSFRLSRLADLWLHPSAGMARTPDSIIYNEMRLLHSTMVEWASSHGQDPELSDHFRG